MRKGILDSTMNINRRRKREIERAREKMERYENWKEWVIASGGSLIKDKDGKYIGVMRIE